MTAITPGYLLPSSCYTLHPRQIRTYRPFEGPPRLGDVIYGRVVSVGEHGSLENRYGRLHAIHDGSRSLFVFGNRYAPDYYEGIVPAVVGEQVDMLARSGIVGEVRMKNDKVKDPTRIQVLGQVVDGSGRPLNTLDHPLIVLKKPHDPKRKRARMILNVGTSMNSGKSTTAKTCCWALKTMGYTVRGAKVTGTASLKDILHMQDAGAEKIADFTYLGYPATYLLPWEQVSDIFRTLDFKFANNPRNFWVVEIADGITQRETAMLLRDEWVRQRIHRLFLSAGDALGAFGAIQILQRDFGLVPDAISGRCTCSPLGIAELQSMTDVPIFENMQWNLKRLAELLI